LQTTTIHAASEGGVSVGRENSGADVSLAASGPNNRKRKKYYKKEQFSLLPLHHAYQAFTPLTNFKREALNGQVKRYLSNNTQHGGGGKKIETVSHAVLRYLERKVLRFLFGTSLSDKVIEFKAGARVVVQDEGGGGRVGEEGQEEDDEGGDEEEEGHGEEDDEGMEEGDEEEDNEGMEEGDGEEEVRIITNKRARV
jgi:hypothetical protein